MKTFVALLAGIVMCTAVVLPPAVAQAATEITASGILTFTNVERYRAGIPLLKIDPLLSQAALQKMRDLFARQYFAHVAPTGEDVSDLVSATGYTYLTVGENLALGTFASSNAVVAAWMQSPGHRENILATKFSQIGIAAGRGLHEGRTVWIIVQTFGMPRSVCPAEYRALDADIKKLERRLTVLEKIVSVREASIVADDISRSVYLERIESYNRAVDVYNAVVYDYRALVAEYNQGVKSFNACLKEKAA